MACRDVASRARSNARNWSRRIDKAHPRREFMRAQVFCDEHGVLRADPNPAVGSHRLRAVADSNALIVVPDGPQRLAAGEVVEVLRYA